MTALGFELTVALRFLREGRMQTALIIGGAAIGVAVIFFITAVLTGVQGDLIKRVTGAQPQRAVRSGDWKLLFDGGRAMLFNVRTDLGERNDLIGGRSEIARRLAPLLATWQQDVDGEAKR